MKKDVDLLKELENVNFQLESIDTEFACNKDMNKRVEEELLLARNRYINYRISIINSLLIKLIF